MGKSEDVGSWQTRLVIDLQTKNLDINHADIV